MCFIALFVGHLVAVIGFEKQLEGTWLATYQIPIGLGLLGMAGLTGGMH